MSTITNTRQAKKAAKKSKRQKKNRLISMRKRHCIYCKWRLKHVCKQQWEKRLGKQLKKDKKKTNE